MTQSALVLFSGGQDSTVCLAWALERFNRVETVGFDYRQRHRVELECRGEILAAIRSDFPSWAGRLGEDHVVDLTSLSTVTETALTQEKVIEFAASGLPNTFVPGRNLLFFTFAAVLAYRRSLKHLVGGVCETDYSGYPDCRDDTIKALQVALNLGMEQSFVLHTPLMWMDKAETWTLASDLGGEPMLRIVRDLTHTCYVGNRSKHNDWGYGCSECPACRLRADGYSKYAQIKASRAAL